jgi:hypothetical protein
MILVKEKVTTSKIQEASDQIFRWEDNLCFHIKDINFRRNYFIYYAKPILFNDFIKEIGNIDKFITLINDFRNKFGVPVEMLCSTFRIIFTDEELKYINKDVPKCIPPIINDYED